MRVLVVGRATRSAPGSSLSSSITATKFGFKHFDRSLAQTNRLRTRGTDALLAAAQEAGVQRFVAQSYASHRYAREGGPVKTEDDPFDPTPVPAMWETEDAMIYLDRAVTTAGGSPFATATSTATPTTYWFRPCGRGSSPPSSAAASGRSSTSTTTPRPPCSRRARRSGHQHRGRRAGRRVGVGAGVGEGGGSQAPQHFPRLLAPAVRGRGPRRDGDRVPAR
jgi:hypothetical protein